MTRETLFVLFLLAIITALTGIIIWGFIGKPWCEECPEKKTTPLKPIIPPPKKKPPKNPPIVTKGDDYKAALSQLGQRIVGKISGEWTSFLNEPARSGSHGALSLRDSLGMFVFLFPDLTMTPTKVGKHKTTDPYQAIQYFPNKLYKAIGDWGDNDKSIIPTSDGYKPYTKCRKIYEFAAGLFGQNYYHQFPTAGCTKGGCNLTVGSTDYGGYCDEDHTCTKCTKKHHPCPGKSYFSDCNVAISLTGDANIPGTTTTWNKYVGSISPSKSYAVSDRSVKVQFWGDYKPSPKLNLLGNMALLVMAQAANTLDTYQDLLAVWKKYHYIIPPLTQPVTAASLKKDHKNVLDNFIDPYHTVRKQIRSLIRSFTENKEISPLTFSQNDSFKCSNDSFSKCYGECVEKGGSILSCLKDYLKPENGKSIFKQIVYGGTKNDKEINKALGSHMDTVRGMTLMYYLHDKTGCGGDSYPNCSAINDDCTVNTKCDWDDCDMVEWFGNIHDAMVAYLGYISSMNSYKKECVVNLMHYINTNTEQFMGLMANSLVNDVLLAMRATYGFVDACKSKEGQKILSDIKDKMDKSYYYLLSCK